MARVIKRYENRKLYDAEEKRYVSLEDIAALVRQDIDIQVIDKASGQDITNQILTQVILEESKKGHQPLTKETLHEVIRFGSELLEGGMKQVQQGLEGLIPDSVSRALGAKSSQEMTELKQRIASLEKMIEKLVAQQTKSKKRNTTKKK